MLKRVSDVKSAGPEDNITGCRAFLIQDTYNDDANVKIMLCIFLLSTVYKANDNSKIIYI